MQLVSELSAVIEDATALNDTGTSEPIKLVLDKAVGIEPPRHLLLSGEPGVHVAGRIIIIIEWAKTPEEQGVGRNVRFWGDTTGQGKRRWGRHLTNALDTIMQA
ncbi:hypothetical protein GUITHDRAFT_118658 [Guillardia theta CCMP2712]|uniref:Uncharacterized protein n=1 Tax=Guillardia theta (strain CCMP2712) TaxID=905079 RepID=L1IFT8_GUITC|nr:hypothetical protein GUITHDRAFT_118658 [Guillardia theta CCMP2712]EKX35108.1 hypothetical protein GUITHDRAFT_118658 [Guillardia theta CCMP2712]|eukprot:XP_005822088.1 hypothetical protein GUITHDRAFT_118658 [Guillardia theta CCMP2712]